MKVTFYSNFLNHHQLPFCKNMYDKLGDDFKFVATTPIPIERLKMGYKDMNKIYPFVITTYDNKENEKKAMDLCIDSDVIIIGSAPEIYVKNRMKENKLTFRYSERVYKRGIWRVISPRGIYSMIKNHTIYKNKNLYMLCASAYTSGDFAMVGAYKGKTYKWGYFPEVLNYDIDKLIKNKPKEVMKILWCGRFLDWKHPEKAIYIANRLKKAGYCFELDMIGIGELEEKIKFMIKEEGLEGYVNLLGAMEPENVRRYMENSNIFLFTSDYNEGWGAVLNESMNSGCAVVASHAIGSVPFLIEHKSNGLIYKNNDDEDLYNNVKILMDDKVLREKLGKSAYYTLYNTWNADVAANSFIHIIDNLLNKSGKVVLNGPCSIADKIYQWDMFRYCNQIKNYEKCREEYVKE